MNLEKEIWKVILQNPNIEVSNMGNIRYKSTQKPLKTFDDKYTKEIKCYISEFKAETVVMEKVATLVLEAFKPVPDVEENYKIKYLDSNLNNLKLNNLEWVKDTKVSNYILRKKIVELESKIDYLTRMVEKIGKKVCSRNQE